MLSDGKRHILVVDDEQDLCEILRFNLEGEGYGVDTALCAEEALELMAQRRYVLVLLDVMMDRMSGFDMARVLRQKGDRTPIIFLTARDGHDDELEGFSVGADDYISKPFSFDTVLARIQAVLRRGADTARVERPQQTIVDEMASGHQPLTRREHLILELFASNPGRWFTRQEIIDEVWPDDTLVGERTVDVHIARLRKKLGADGQRIVNKTGFGYGLA